MTTEAIITLCHQTVLVANVRDFGAGLAVPNGAVITGDAIAVRWCHSRSQESRITLLADVNRSMLRIPAGAANVHLRHLHFDGNRNNNAIGNVIHLDDAPTGEESGLDVDSMLVDAAAGNGIYVGARRRAAMIRDSQILNSSAARIRINGSDAGIDTCIVDSSAGIGIEIAGLVCRMDLLSCVRTWWQRHRSTAGVNMVALVANGVDGNH